MIKIKDMFEKRPPGNLLDEIIDLDKTDDNIYNKIILDNNSHASILRIFGGILFCRACLWHKFSPESLKRAKKQFVLKITKIKSQFDRIEILQSLSNDTISLMSKLNWKLFEQFSVHEIDSSIIQFYMGRQIIPRNLLSTDLINNRTTCIALIKNQNLKFIFNDLFPNAKWDMETPFSLANKFKLRDNDLDILFMHQDLPNLTSAFLLPNGDVNLNIFVTWLTNICPFQTIPMELLDEPFFSVWINSCQFFSRARFSEIFIKQFVEKTKNMKSVPDQHWFFIFSKQNISEDFALLNRHRPHFANCNVNFSSKIVRLWKQIDLIELFRSNKHLSHDLIKRMFSPKYVICEGTCNEYLINKLADENELWGDERWTKSTNTGLNLLPQTLFNSVLPNLPDILPEKESKVLMANHAQFVEMLLITNNVPNNIFTREFCAKNQNYVEYAIKHCSLSDSVINEIITSCGLIKFSQWLIKYQILPSQVISDLLKKDVQTKELIEHQRFSNDQIRLAISIDIKNLELIWRTHDLSQAGRDFLFENYFNHLKFSHFNNLKISPRKFLLSNYQLVKLYGLDFINIIKYGKLSNIAAFPEHLLEKTVMLRGNSGYVPSSIVYSSADSFDSDDLYQSSLCLLLTTTKLSEDQVFNFIVNYHKISYQTRIGNVFIYDETWIWIILVQDFSQINNLEKLKNIIPWHIFFEYSKNVTVEVVKRFCSPQENHTFAIIRNNQISNEVKDEIITAFPELSWPKIAIQPDEFDDFTDEISEVDEYFESTDSDDDN